MTHPVKKIAQHGQALTGRPRSAPLSLPDTPRATKSEATFPLDFAKQLNAVGQARHASSDNDWTTFGSNFYHPKHSKPPLGLYPNPPRFPPVTARKACATCDGSSRGTAPRGGHSENVAYFDGYFQLPCSAARHAASAGPGLSEPSAKSAQAVKTLGRHERRPQRINYRLKQISLTCCHKIASMMIVFLRNIVSNPRNLRG